MAGGKVTAVDVTQVPWRDHKDQEINSRAVPILNEEAVSAQSAVPVASATIRRVEFNSFEIFFLI